MTTYGCGHTARSISWELGHPLCSLCPKLIAVHPSRIYLGYTVRKMIKAAPCFQGVSTLI